MGKIVLRLDDQEDECFAVVKTTEGRYILGTTYNIPQCRFNPGTSDEDILASYTADDIAVVINRPDDPEEKITVAAYRILAEIGLDD